MVILIVHITGMFTQRGMAEELVRSYGLLVQRIMELLGKGSR
jgi:hypothetical protein